ncbi:NAD-dependent epimerase/dehydratase family protein [Eubacterium sp.]|mgnify:CR=1 FL=1
MKVIVVFGASGDIGRYYIKYLCEHLDLKEFSIVATGTKKLNKFEEYPIEYTAVDITNKEEFKKLPKKVYAVVDFAGMMPARMEGYDPQKYIDVNITGTLNVLEYCKTSGADRMMFTQSFGDIKDNSEEDIVLKPDSPKKFGYNNDHTIYVLSKNFAVDMMENYHQMFGIKTFVFRLPTIYLYSPIEHYYVDGKIRWIGYKLLINQAINGTDIEVWGDPNRKKDMVYVKDLCQMMYKALFAKIDTGVYNVGTGIGTSLIDQIKGIVEVFGDKNNKSNIIMRPEKPNAPQYIMDISNAKEDLGYEPKYNYIDMLIDMKKERDLDRF